MPFSGNVEVVDSKKKRSWDSCPREKALGRSEMTISGVNTGGSRTVAINWICCCLFAVFGYFRCRLVQRTRRVDCVERSSTRLGPPCPVHWPIWRVSMLLDASTKRKSDAGDGNPRSPKRPHREDLHVHLQSGNSSVEYWMVQW
jgi:hypothetical protein